MGLNFSVYQEITKKGNLNRYDWDFFIKIIVSFCIKKLSTLRKVIYPYQNKDRLELRVCREFKPLHWCILMDTTTGKIFVEQDVTISFLN